MRFRILIGVLIVVISLVSTVPLHAAELPVVQAQTSSDCFTFQHHIPSRFVSYFASPTAKTFYSSFYEVILLFVYVPECGRYLYGVFDSTNGKMITHYFPKELAIVSAGYVYILDKIKYYGAVARQFPGNMNFLVPIPIPCSLLTGSATCGIPTQS